MVHEYDYASTAEKQFEAVLAAKGQAEDRGVSDEADQALMRADNLHSLIDEVETRLFGAVPRAVSPGAQTGEVRPRPAVAHSVKGIRQRVESANDRLAKVLARL